MPMTSDQKPPERITIQELSLEIGQEQAKRNPLWWNKPEEADNDMNQTIASLANQIGRFPTGNPGVRPLICKMAEEGKIKPRCTLNGLPFLNTETILENPASWYLSQEDADIVRKYLLGEEKAKSVSGKTVQWWEDEYNILELAQQFGEELMAKTGKASQNDVSKKVESHINSKEARKTTIGQKARGISTTSLKKGPMKKWKYKSDK